MHRSYQHLISSLPREMTSPMSDLHVLAAASACCELQASGRMDGWTLDLRARGEKDARYCLVVVLFFRLCVI